jgi:PAS domain S-box-containing protein
MTNKDPINIIYYRQRGWLNVGRTRMILFDLLQGFSTLRQVVNKEVGANASYLIWQAGIKGGFSFLEPMIRGGRLIPGPEGFLAGLSTFTDGGFGDFQIQEMDWHKGWARITCRSSVEGWICSRKRFKVKKPACDYSRGIILGFMQATHRHAGTGLEETLDCVEIACLTQGHPHCEFLIGTRDMIQTHGYECSQPRKSIQQQLRERVLEKTLQIREANRFNERILTHAPVGILTLDAEGVVISANKAVARILDIPYRDLLNVKLLSQHHALPTLIEQSIVRALRGEKFELEDCPLPTMDSKSDSRRFVAVKGIPLKNIHGFSGGLLCIMEDTTEKTLAAKRIEYLKNYDENIIQSITDGIMVLDQALRIRTWNRKMEEIFFLKAKRVLGRSLEELSWPVLSEEFMEHLKDVLRTGNSFEKKGFRLMTRIRGTIVLNLKILPLLDKDGGVSGIIVLHEDVTERERVEVRYRNLFETAQDGICITDLKGRILSANKKVLKILETDCETLAGVSLSGFLPPPKRTHLIERLALAIGGRDVEPYEVEMISASGRWVPVELSITPVKQDEKVVGLQIIGRDITARKRIEEEMIQSSKLAAVGELASGVAHEINNPLASVAGYAEDMLDILQEKGSTAEELTDLKDGLRTILEQTNRCKEIIQSLLNFARQGDFEVIPVDINDLIGKTLVLIEPDIKSSKTKVYKKLDKLLPAAETNPSQLQQVFLNILKNALDALDSAGELRITSQARDGFIQIKFQDNGKGIPPENLGRIFNPFFTTKPPGQGTGLGLSICYRIMEKLKGTIKVDSQMGFGSTFVVSIPRQWASAEKGEVFE